MWIHWNILINSIYMNLINTFVIIRRWMGVNARWKGKNVRQLTTHRSKSSNVSRWVLELWKLQRNQFQALQWLFSLWFCHFEWNRFPWIYILQKTRMNMILSQKTRFAHHLLILIILKSISDLLRFKIKHLATFHYHKNRKYNLGHCQ